MNRYNIAGVLSSFKRDWSGVFEREGLKDLCLSLGYKWRKRILPPVQTVELLLMQVLHGNTAISSLRHIAGIKFSASAYCQARTRLPLQLLSRILERMNGKLRREATKTRIGPRTFLVDGSSFSMPDTNELRDYFGYPGGQKQGCGFPMGHLLALFDSGTKMLLKLIPGKLFTHDLADVLLIHSELKKGDIIVGDRAFCSFGHVATLCLNGVHAVFRMHQRLSTAIKQPKDSALRHMRRLGAGDCLFEWKKTNHIPSWMQKAQFDKLPSTIQIRRLSYKITQRGFRSHHIYVFTTLLDSALYPAEEIAELYRSRWEVELNFRHLKTSMKMDVLRSKSIASVLKELHAFAIVYNLVCLVMLEAALRQNVSVQRISFIDALRWFIGSTIATSPILLIVNPLRPNRSEPRAVKRRPKSYQLLTKPRIAYKKAA